TGFGDREVGRGQVGDRSALLVQHVDEHVPRLLRLAAFLPRCGGGGSSGQDSGKERDRRFHASLPTMRILYGPWSSETSVSCRTAVSNSSTRRASRRARSITRTWRRYRWRAGRGRPTTTPRCG